MSGDEYGDLSGDDDFIPLPQVSMIDTDNCLDCNSGSGCALHFNPPFGVGSRPVPVGTTYRSKSDVAADLLLRDATQAMLQIFDTVDDEKILTRDEAMSKLLRIKAITVRTLSKIDSQRVR